MLIKAQEVVNSGAVRAAPTNVRFDSTQLNNMIISTAMLKHVIPVIGEDTYNYLVSKRTAGITNYNTSLGALNIMFPNDSDLENLWKNQYLETLCATSVIYVWIPYGTLQNTSQGNQLVNTQYSQNGDIKSIQFIQDTILNDMQAIKDKVKKYVCDNFQIGKNEHLKNSNTYPFIPY